MERKGDPNDAQARGKEQKEGGREEMGKSHWLTGGRGQPDQSKMKKIWKSLCERGTIEKTLIKKHGKLFKRSWKQTCEWGINGHRPRMRDS